MCGHDRRAARGDASPGNAGANDAEDHSSCWTRCSPPSFLTIRSATSPETIRALFVTTSSCEPTRPGRASACGRPCRGEHRVLDRPPGQLPGERGTAVVPGGGLGRGDRDRRQGPRRCVGRRAHRADGPVEMGEGARLICRRERPHPGAQLSMFDCSEGYRHTCFITNAIETENDAAVAVLELRHRGHARSRTASVTGRTAGYRTSRLHRSPRTSPGSPPASSPARCSPGPR